MAGTIAQLQAIVGADTSGFTSGIKDAQDKTKSFGSSLSEIGKSAGAFALAQIGVSSFSDVLGIAKDTIGGWVQGAMDAQVAQAHLNQVLDSGQHVIGLTSDAVNKMVQQFAAQDNMDDDAVQGAANVFAAYSSIGKDAYPQVTQAALQMARAQQLATGGQLDAQGAATALANVLQKPTRAMQQLRQYGVQLTQQDQDQINTWAKKGDQASIQALLMDRVKSATSGAVDAYNNTAQGKIEAFHTKMDNLGKGLATNVLPAIGGLADAGTNFLGWLGSAGGPLSQFGSLLSGIGGKGGPADLFASIMAQSQPILKTLGGIFKDTLVPAFKDLMPLLKQIVTDDLAELGGMLKSVQPILKLFGDILHNVILPVFKTLVGVIETDVLPTLKNLMDIAEKQLMPAFLKLWTAIEPLAELLANILGPVLQVVGWILSHIVGPALGLLINLLAAAITVVADVIGFVTHFGDVLGWLGDKIGGLLGHLGDLKDLIGGVLKSDLNTIHDVFQHVSDAVQALIGHIGDLLGKLGAVKDAIGGAVGGVLSHIPGFAEGTPDAPGGFAMVGESGPELMYVPQHARIYPHGAAPAGSGASGNSGNGGRHISIGAMHVYGDDADSTARAVVAELNWQQMLVG